MRVFFISLYDEWCLGLRSISAVLREAGHEAGIAYLHSMPEMHRSIAEGDPEGYNLAPSSVPGADIRALLDLAKSFKPDIIGFSFTSNFSGLAEVLTAKLRKILPVPIVWGGVDVTASPDTSIQHADIACIGEGEDAMLELVERLSKGEPIRDIGNLWVREGETIHKNAVRPLVQDLSTIPHCDFDQVNKWWVSGGAAHAGAIPANSHLERNYPIMATRGCPYACTFCCNSLYRDLYGNKDYVRLRPVAHVIDELKKFLAVNPNIQFIEFWDDVFGTRQDWVEEFADIYPKEIGLPYWAYTYPAFCKPELVKNLKRSGISFVVMGLQTGSQKTLKDLYNRNSPRKRVIEAAQMLKDAGIPLIMDLIGSNPFETEADNRETLELLLDCPTPYALQPINALTFFRNFPITQRALEVGHISCQLPGRNVSIAEPKKEYRFWSAILSLPQFETLDRDAIRKMADDPYLRENPEIVEAIFKGLCDTTYLAGTRVRRSERERGLETELARLRGSRGVQLFLKMKSLLGRNGKKNGQAKKNGNGNGGGDHPGNNGNGSHGEREAHIQDSLRHELNPMKEHTHC